MTGLEKTGENSRNFSLDAICPGEYNAYSITPTGITGLEKTRKKQPRVLRLATL